MPHLYHCVAAQGDPVQPNGAAVVALGSHTRLPVGRSLSDAVAAVKVPDGGSVYILQNAAWEPISEFDLDYACKKSDAFYFRVEIPLLSVTAGSTFQEFAKTVGDPQMTPCGKFWKISGDLTANFDTDFLLWNRAVYSDLETQIQHDLEKGYGTFIVLGTAGAGKSMFAIYFMLKQGMKSGKPILFKKGKEVYVIDGRNGRATGPYEMSSPQIQALRFDKEAWLVIDGMQEGQLVCRCKVLQVCSTKKENFEEAGKVGKAQKLYMPVWSEDEVEAFLAEYEPYRATYQNQDSERAGMCVPTLDKIREQYKLLGGVARYLLQERKLVDGRDRLATAIKRIATDVKVVRDVLSGGFIQDLSDCLLHFIPASDLTRKKLDFASHHVWHEVRKAYKHQQIREIARFLEDTVDSSSLETVWGKMYKIMVHRRISEGGSFHYKEVSEGGVISEGIMEVLPRTWKLAKDIPEMKLLVADDFYASSRSKNLQSVDSALKLKDAIALVQAFRRADGRAQNYKVQGLQKIHEVFKASKYELWSSVPVELYSKTGYQPYVNNDDGKYGAPLKLLDTIKQYVVQVDYQCKIKTRKRRKAANLDNEVKRRIDAPEQDELPKVQVPRKSKKPKVKQESEDEKPQAKQESSEDEKPQAKGKQRK